MIQKVKNKMNRMMITMMFPEVCEDNRGMGVIEVMLIIVVLIGLVVVFKRNITSVVNTIFNKITSKVNTF